MDRLSDIMALMSKPDRAYGVGDSIDEHQEKIGKLVQDSTQVRDGYGNSLLSIGEQDKSASFTNYSLDNDTLNWTLWTTLYNDSWVFKRAIDKPAQDEIRCGITINADTDRLDEVYKLVNKHRSDLINLLQWGALYGGAVACMMFDTVKDEDYKRPLDTKAVRKCKAMRLYVVDRWYGVSPSNETVTDMTDVDFGKPKYYDVSFPDGHTVRFHHSYVLRYEHRTAPKLIKCGQLQGWGYAEGAHILNELMRDDKLTSSIQSLIDKSLIEVIKMSGMRGVFMGGDTETNQQLQKRLEMVNWGRNFNSLTFLDKDDEYDARTFSGLSGLSDLLEKNMWRVSAALDMQGVLYGDLKSGFANDADALERYDDTINCRCEAYVRPVYEKLIKVVYIILGIDEAVDFTFNSMLMKKHDKEHMTDVKDFVGVLSQMLNDGVLDLQGYARALNTYSKTGVVDFGFTEDAIGKLGEAQIDEAEDFDIGQP